VGENETNYSESRDYEIPSAEL